MGFWHRQNPIIVFFQSQKNYYLCKKSVIWQKEHRHFHKLEPLMN